jgi:hypothetical protein
VDGAFLVASGRSTHLSVTSPAYVIRIIEIVEAGVFENARRGGREQQPISFATLH